MGKTGEISHWGGGETFGNPNFISLLWLLGHSGLSMLGKILESISELSIVIVLFFTKGSLQTKK